MELNNNFIKFLKTKLNLSDDVINEVFLILQKSNNTTFGNILLNMGILEELKYIQLLSEFYKIEIFDISNDYKKCDNLDNIESFLKENIVPVKLKNKCLFVVDYNLKINQIIEYFHNMNQISIVLALQSEIEEIKNIYLHEYDIDSNFSFDKNQNEEKLEELASEAPVIKMINNYLFKAVKDNASDIHFESFENGLNVRFRIDGILKKIDIISNYYKKAVIARLKLLSKMNISENRLPQDGRFSILIKNEDIDIRASSIPNVFGESFVLRILRKNSINYDIDSLEIYQDHKKQIEKLISYSNGVLLMTGPTGSGKTTTLYSLLNKLNSESRKIITVEDPVEYELHGINQIQVHSDINFTFQKALRSILRQDPDIIMIGEIRDVETANIAIQASLTGHLVLSTLHTNSAIGAIDRLMDMGIELFLLKSSIKGLMAQRLVRKLCPFCKKELSLTKELKNNINYEYLINNFGHLLEQINTFKAVGCEKCFYTGYSGRMPIMEIIEIDEKVFKNIKNLHYRSLKEDGILKFLEGKTTLEEVLRVIN